VPPLTSLPFIAVNYDSTCSNGILDAGEECDDGNQFSGDGCNWPHCKLENASNFVCVNVTEQGPTECCPSLTNPVTNQQVCSCENQASDNAGKRLGMKHARKKKLPDALQADCPRPLLLQGTSSAATAGEST
jgi:cysteine-rich repeat protein